MQIEKEMERMHENMDCKNDDGGICKVLAGAAAAGSVQGPVQGKALACSRLACHKHVLPHS